MIGQGSRDRLNLGYWAWIGVDPSRSQLQVIVDSILLITVDNNNRTASIRRIDLPEVCFFSIARRDEMSITRKGERWPKGLLIPAAWNESSAHFCEQLFVMVHNVLATDHWREIHFDPVLSTPRSEVLKNLCIALSLEECGYTASTRCMNAKQHLKAWKLVSLGHLT